MRILLPLIKTKIQMVKFSHSNFVNHLLKSWGGKDLVNKSAGLSLERICRTSISPFFWRSCVKNNFGEMFFVLSSFIKPSFNWDMHATLFSKSIVGILTSHFKPHLSLIKCITDLNHTHSLLASWMTIISAWFEEVATMTAS